MEKRRLDSLSLVAKYASTPGGWNVAFGIGINPATGRLWVVGNGETAEGQIWRIEALDRGLNRLMVLKPGIRGGAYGVVFDEGGNAYVYGIGGVVKYSKDGKELAKAVGNLDVNGVVAVKDMLYIFTTDHRLFIFMNLRKVAEIDLWREVSKHVNVEIGIVTLPFLTGR